MKIRYSASTMLLLLAASGFGAVYFVDGQISANCDGTAYHYDVATRSRVSGAGQIAWMAVSFANMVLNPGDTVYIRGGTYTIGAYDPDKNTPDEGIRPINSGTNANNRITYASYQKEKVQFVGKDDARGAQAIVIAGRNWIKITGYDGFSSATNMSFSNVQEFVWISDYPRETGYPYGIGSSYNEIAYCEFTKQDKTTTENEWDGGSKLQHNSNYNWIHHCKFHSMGGNHGDRDISYCLNLGWESCGTGEPDTTCHDNSSYNVIENNEFYHGGHHTVLLLNPFNVLRKNVLHNEQWYKGPDSIWYGYRVITMHGVYNTDLHLGYDLIEGNRISHATNNMNASLGGEGIHLGTSNNIVRYNDFYANGGNAIYLENHQVATTGRINFNHIYNNTFFANGYEAIFPNATNPLVSPHNWMANPPDRSPLYFVSGDLPDPVNPYNHADYIWKNSMYGNVVKNNLSWKNAGQFTVSGMYNHGRGFDACTSLGQTVCGNTVIASNWTKNNSDPKFTSEGDYGNPKINNTDVEWYWGARTPDGSDITKINTEPNFNVQENSPVIDSGTYLTLANGSGANSTTLIVNDAKYFQPGWGNGAGGGAVVQADWIAIGTVSNTVQIRSIDYDSNKLTLVSPVTWSDKAPVWLYKKSDGAVVLHGNAPDCGAHEYSSANNVRTVTPTKTTFTAGPMMLFSLRGQVVGELKGMRASGPVCRRLKPGVYFVRTSAGGKYRFLRYAVIK